uniref:Uncharacterized protein n=1 Tax=Paramoeba aestuarina TaxID=180227 RepID=A0A7S4NUS9_9EUKA
MSSTEAETLSKPSILKGLGFAKASTDFNRMKGNFREKKKTRHEYYGRSQNMESEHVAVLALLRKKKDAPHSQHEINSLTKSLHDSSRRYHMDAYLQKQQTKGVAILTKHIELDDITEIDDAHLNTKLKELQQEKWKRKAEERRQRVKVSGEKYNQSVLAQKLCQGPSGPGFAAHRGRPQVQAE